MLFDDDLFIDGIADSNFRNYSRIVNGTVMLNDTEYKNFVVQLNPFDPSDECMDVLGFSWNITGFTEEELKL